jgi:YVTN family beta-propeller protein
MFKQKIATAGAFLLAGALTMEGCSAPPAPAEKTAAGGTTTNAAGATTAAAGNLSVAATAGRSGSPTGTAQGDAPLAGMPPLLEPDNIYAANRAGNLSPNVARFPERVYVPNTVSNSVDVIDPVSLKVIDHFEVGRQPQHVTPSYDLQHLWVLNDLGDSVTEIDPATGKPGKTIPVKDPYNMYYTPDGQFAVVVAEREQKLDFLNPKDMKLVEALPVPCRGVDHMDFSADGRFLIASCEFAGSLLKVDVSTRRVVGTLPLKAGGMPQDVRSAPDGKLFYVADMMANGVYVIDPHAFSKVEFIPTGKGAHGIAVSRDAKVMYVSNRGEGSVSVIDFATRKPIAKWQIPGGGSPDMGGLSVDGNTLWLSGRYNAEVYALDTRDGHVVARIKVGKGPHGLAVFPQPGRYSLGHNGNFR